MVGGGYYLEIIGEEDKTKKNYKVQFCQKNYKMIMMRQVLKMSTKSQKFQLYIYIYILLEQKERKFEINLCFFVEVKFVNKTNQRFTGYLCYKGNQLYKKFLLKKEKKNYTKTLLVRNYKCLTSYKISKFQKYMYIYLGYHN